MTDFVAVFYLPLTAVNELTPIKSMVVSVDGRQGSIGFEPVLPVIKKGKEGYSFPFNMFLNWLEWIPYLIRALFNIFPVEVFGRASTISTILGIL